MTEPHRSPSARASAAVRRASAAVVMILLISGCSVPAVSVGSASRGPSDPDSGQTAAPPSGPPERVVFASAAPVVSADSLDADGLASVVPDSGWVAEVAGTTLIPERALVAYAGAALESAGEDPGCAMSWNLLAGIGQVESRHGFIDGSRLDGDGRARPAIIGIALDGIDVASIPDSDDGLLDGDDSVDRAVGPLQLIPQSWRTWGVDADEDGAVDPQDIDDASLAAAHYLCRTGDLAAPESWRRAVLSWNRSEEYLEDVSSWAAFYGDAAAGRRAGGG